MKILVIDRGHAKVEDGEKYVTIEGEMLFFENATKMGFTLYLYTMEFWETPMGKIALDAEDRERIVDYLQQESANNDNYLDLVFTP